MKFSLKDYIKRPNCDKNRHTWSTWKTLESREYASDCWKIVQTRICTICNYIDVDNKVIRGF